MTKKFSAVLFDLDGTLLDTLQDIADSVNRVLAARGFPAHPALAYKDFVGEGATVLIRRALPENNRAPALVAAVLDEYRRDYATAWNVTTHPYDGVPEMLEALTARGLKLGVLSNKPHAETVKCAQAYFSKGRFGIVLGQRDEVARKPNPAGAFEVAQALGVPAERIIYVGDTGIDMTTANAAGMFAVGVTWGFRPESELHAHGAKAVAHRPAEILQLLA